MSHAFVTVVLSPERLVFAATVGVQRSVQNIIEGRNNRYGCDNDVCWQRSVTGAIGECAVAQHQRVSWDGAIGNYAAKDAGLYQVRCSEYPMAKLCVHPTQDERGKKGDADEDVFILALAHALPRVFLVGWLFGHEAKRPEWWGEVKPGFGRKAFFAPHEALHPIETLPDLSPHDDGECARLTRLVETLR